MLNPRWVSTRAALIKLVVVASYGPVALWFQLSVGLADSKHRGEMATSRHRGGDESHGDLASAESEPAHNAALPTVDEFASPALMRGGRVLPERAES